ncbi:MAG: ferredoxin family protein [Syntrophobacteraceae bacterium]
MEGDQQADKTVKQRKSAGVKRPKESASEDPKSSSGKKQYEIDIFRGWCKSCGICAAFCPRECIQLDADGAPHVAESDRCTGCGWCELHCPDFAISVRERSEKAPSQEI